MQERILQALFQPPAMTFLSEIKLSIKFIIVFYFISFLKISPHSFGQVFVWWRVPLLHPKGGNLNRSQTLFNSSSSLSNISVKSVFCTGCSMIFLIFSESLCLSRTSSLNYFSSISFSMLWTTTLLPIRIQMVTRASTSMMIEASRTLIIVFGGKWSK